jgi:membrane-associated protease RseP (regulator of RpoE activity)
VVLKPYLISFQVHGAGNVLDITALLSIMLGVMNLLPIPALVVMLCFYMYEIISGKNQ